MYLTQSPEQSASGLTPFAEQFALDLDRDRHGLMQALQARTRDFNPLGAGVGAAPGPEEKLLGFKNANGLRNLHRLDAPRPCKINLCHRLAGTAKPGDERQQHELQVCQINGGESPIHFPLISPNDAPHHEADGVFRRAERHLLKHTANCIFFHMLIAILSESKTNGEACSTKNASSCYIYLSYQVQAANYKLI